MPHFLASRVVALLLIFVTVSSLMMGAASAATGSGVDVRVATEPIHDHSTHDHGASGNVLPDGVTCEDLGFTTVWGDYCSHGHDDPPMTAAAALDLTPLSHGWDQSQLCDGDGESGKRVQMIYARASDTSDRSSYVVAFAGSSWALNADKIVFESARRFGGNRHIRFVHDEQCRPTVENVTLSPEADDNFGRTIQELFNLGYNRADRKYLILMDAYFICGTASFIPDDRAGDINNNNHASGMARVDAGCWNGETVAHEIMHMLGAVQNSAPNSSGGGHCTDEWDLLCYSDPPSYPTMRIVCGDGSLDARLDCNGDDYFNPNPAPDSYLATNWNTADSQFMIAGENPPACYDAALERDPFIPDTPRLSIPGVATRAFCEEYDYDTYTVRMVAGRTYRFETRNLTAPLDTVLTLNSFDGYFTRAIASDNDGNGGLASRIDYTATADGNLYIEVTERHGRHDALATYELHVSRVVNDATAPTSSASVGPAAEPSGWHRGPVTIDLSATDNTGGSGVKSLTVSATGAEALDETTIEAASTTLTISEPGTTVVTWYATDHNGNQEAAQSLTVKIDTTAPTTRKFAHVAKMNGETVGVRIPYRFTWEGSDAGGSGIRRYEIERSRNRGTIWTRIALNKPSAQNATILLNNRWTAFRLRAIDRAGNVGEWTYSIPIVQHYLWGSGVPPTVRTTGDWDWEKIPGGFGEPFRSTRTTRDVGATLTFKFVGRRVIWVGQSTPGHVRAELRADGEYLGTIDLYEKDPESKTPGAAEVVWTHEFATPKQRILEIKLVHVSPNPDAKLMVEVLVDVTRK